MKTLQTLPLFGLSLASLLISTDPGSCEDVTPPVIQCPGTITRYICGSSAQVYYNLCATDDSGTVGIIYNPPPGSVFAANTSTIVTATAYDPSGNTSVCTFTVKVLDS